MTHALFWRRHARFLIALVIGVMVAVVAPVPRIDRILLGADLFFALYLLFALLLAGRLTVADLRAHGVDDDEGAGLIVMLALAAIGLCMWALLGMMTQQNTGHHQTMRLMLAIASVPLSWATLNIVMAFHYARLYYMQTGDGQDSGGLDFPGSADPNPWDFLYFSLTLGMTFQTADVAITLSRMRRTVLGHSLLSFLFNTVIIALSVNGVISLG